MGKRFAFLGDISYSSYLLHFPLQLLFVAVVGSITAGSAFFYTPLSLILFFVLLIPLSLASFTFFERPSQALIRRMLGRWAGKVEPGKVGERAEGKPPVAE